MLQEIEDAMKSVDIFLDKQTYYNDKNIKDLLMSTPKDQIKAKTKDFLFLLKNLPNSVYGNFFNIDKEKDDILEEAIKAAKYDEESETITIRMEGLKAAVHYTFFKSFQEAFKKVEPLGKTETRINLDYLMIPDDFSRTKFDGCLIVMKSVDESSIEINLCGSSAILILVFYLERVIKLFLRSCKKKTIWSSLYYCSPVHSSKDSTEDLKDIESVSDAESLPEVERKYGGPFSSTPADAALDDSLHLSSPSSSGGHENICVNCALIESSLSISNICSAEYEIEMHCCSTLRL